VTDDAPYLLDVTRLIWRRWKGRLPTGIDRVCLAYLRHFANRSQAVVQHKSFRRILDRAASLQLFDLLEGPSERFRRKIAWALLRHLDGLNSAGNGRIYLNIGHTGLDSPGFRKWVVRSNVCPVYLVHDLIPITHPQFCRAGEGDRHRARMRTVLTTAAGIIGNSQWTLDELETFARAERLPEPPTLDAWLGVDPLPRPPKIQANGPPTFVVLGTIEARKNHLMLLEIWERLAERLGNESPQLLIIGQRGWEADGVFRFLQENHRIRGHVFELGRCSDTELVEHLAWARALLFPTMVEGYGLPLVEALGIGVPVIASDLPTFREIAGDIPDYLAANDTAAWEAAILDYSRSDSVARAAQIQRMQGFREPTWEEHFQIVENWLGTLT
jgi:glycosyltransferase involved in cell wall biosynthesis